MRAKKMKRDWKVVNSITNSVVSESNDLVFIVETNIKVSPEPFLKTRCVSKEKRILFLSIIFIKEKLLSIREQTGKASILQTNYRGN